jgi:hypothetical protein
MRKALKEAELALHAIGAVTVHNGFIVGHL